MKRRIFMKPFHKRLVVLLCAGLFYSACIFGQDETASSGGSGKLHFGAKVGTTISSFTDQQPHTDIKQGIIVGGFASFYFDDNMAVQGEVNYLQQGGKLIEVENPADISKMTWYDAKVYNNSVTVHTIDIPVLFKYSYPIGDVKVSALIGPSFGLITDAGISSEVVVFTEVESVHTYTTESNVSDKIDAIDYTGTAGISIEVPIGGLNLLVDARYRYGFNSIYKSYSYKNIPQIKGDLQCHSWYFTIGVGL